MRAGCLEESLYLYPIYMIHKNDHWFCRAPAVSSVAVRCLRLIWPPLRLAHILFMCLPLWANYRLLACATYRSTRTHIYIYIYIHILCGCVLTRTLTICLYGNNGWIILYHSGEETVPAIVTAVISGDDSKSSITPADCCCSGHGSRAFERVAGKVCRVDDPRTNRWTSFELTSIMAIVVSPATYLLL